MSVRKFPPPQSRNWRYSQLRLTCSYANINCTPLIYMWGASGQSNIALGGFPAVPHRAYQVSSRGAVYLGAKRRYYSILGYCLWEPVITKSYRALTLILSEVQTHFGSIKYAAWLKESIIRQAIFTRNFKSIGWRRKNWRKCSCCTVMRSCVAHWCYGTRKQSDFIYRKRDMTELRVICIITGGTDGSWFITDEWSKKFYSNR